jgi:hypothetical protein
MIMKNSEIIEEIKDSIERLEEMNEELKNEKLKEELEKLKY